MFRAPVTPDRGSVSPWRPLVRLWMVWSVVVMLCSAFGLFSAYQEHRKDLDMRGALEGIGTFAALGLGVATSLTAGLLALANARCGRWKKGQALFLVLGSPAPCALLTHLTLTLAHDLLPWFLWEE